jgi:hypothetical protein
MALTTTTLGSPLGAKIYIDTDADETAEIASTDALTIYHVKIDNTANSAAAYLKIVDADTATVGTTDASFIFFCASSSTANYAIPTGLACNAGMVFWCTTASIKTSTDGPTNDVEVQIHTS